MDQLKGADRGPSLQRTAADEDELRKVCMDGKPVEDVHRASIYPARPKHLDFSLGANTNNNLKDFDSKYI